MKRIMNKWTALAVAAVSVVVAVVQVDAEVLRLTAAPGFSQSVVVSGTTSGAYAAVTNNTSAYPTNAIIYCQAGKDVVLSWTASLSDSGTTANTLTVYESLDGTNWEWYNAFAMTPAGTTAKTVVTNLTVGAVPYLKVYSIANANANTGYITNQTVTALVK